MRSAGLFLTFDPARLNETQLGVLATARTHAALLSAAALDSFTSMVEGLGFTHEDALHTLAFVRDHAQVTINFQADRKLTAPAPNGGQTVIDAFLSAEPHYKNQFETRITGGSPGFVEGSCRDGWEKTLFREGYHGHPLIPEERPKYGALNARRNPGGGSLGSYGNCYLELRREVGLRATFTGKNSSGCKADDVGTLEHLAHVVAKNHAPYGSSYGASYSQLKDIIRTALGEEVPVNTSGTYIEAQVHGPIEFSLDVERVVAHTLNRKTPYEEKLRELAKKYGLLFAWTDGKTVSPDP